MTTLLLLHLSLTAAPILFVGLDGSGTGYTNGLAAQNQFRSHLRQERTASFLCGDPSEESCRMDFGNFSGVIVGHYLRGNSAVFPIPEGAQSVPSVSALGGWGMNLSTGVSAIGFYFVDAYLDDIFLTSPNYVGLRIGNTPLLIDPAEYGIALRSRYSGFIGIVDPDTSYNRIDLGLSDAYFHTSLVTAATPDQIVPEPSSVVCLGAGLAIIAAWMRARSLPSPAAGPKFT